VAFPGRHRYRIVDVELDRDRELRRVRRWMPEPEALRDAFEEDTGTYSTTYHPNVSTISGSWP
jgi:hypothetical protein